MPRPIEAQEIIQEFAGPQALLEMALEIKWLRKSLDRVGWFPRDGKDWPSRGLRAQQED